MGRQKQVEAVQRFEQAEWFLQKQTAVASQLSVLRRPFKPEILDLVRPRAGQYGEDRMRYQFLVIRGGSCSGKSTCCTAKRVHTAFYLLRSCRLVDRSHKFSMSLYFHSATTAGHQQTKSRPGFARCAGYGDSKRYWRKASAAKTLLLASWLKDGSTDAAVVS